MLSTNSETDWNKVAESTFEDLEGDWDVVVDLEESLKIFRHRVVPAGDNSLTLDFEVTEVAVLSTALSYLVATQNAKGDPGKFTP